MLSLGCVCEINCLPSCHPPPTSRCVSFPPLLLSLPLYSFSFWISVHLTSLICTRDCAKHSFLWVLQTGIIITICNRALPDRLSQKRAQISIKTKFALFSDFRSECRFWSLWLTNGPLLRRCPSCTELSCLERTYMGCKHKEGTITWLLVTNWVADVTVRSSYNQQSFQCEMARMLQKLKHQAR